jgi:hypothetical protein
MRRPFPNFAHAPSENRAHHTVEPSHVQIVLFKNIDCGKKTFKDKSKILIRKNIFFPT